MPLVAAPAPEDIPPPSRSCELCSMPWEFRVGDPAGKSIALCWGCRQDDIDLDAKFPAGL